MRTLSLVLLLSTPVYSASVPLKDNVLFAFEKCKSLSVDLKKGQLIEAVAPAFDLHCRQVKERPQDFRCEYFDPATNKKLHSETFSGGSELGEGELKEASGKKLRFLIGKEFASYESGPEQKVCAGIFLFEQDAIKQKSKP